MAAENLHLFSMFFYVNDEFERRKHIDSKLNTWLVNKKPT